MMMTTIVNSHWRRKRGRGDRRGTCPHPPQIRENIFSTNYHVKFGHFAGKCHEKFVNFVDLGENIIKKFGHFDSLLGKYHAKFGHFVNFSIHNFRAKIFWPSKVD